MLAKLKKKGLGLAAAVGLGLAVVLTALLCLPLAAAMEREALPLDAAPLCAVIAAGLAVFAASLAMGRIRQRQALVTAGCVAGGYLVLAALLCVLGGAGASFGSWIWRLGAAVLAGALLGSVMSIRQKAHKKRRK